MAASLTDTFRRLPLGLRYMVGAAFFFSLMSLCVKVVGQRLPSAQVVLARSVIALVLSYGMLRRAGVAPWGERKGLLVLRGLLGFLALLCFFYAIPRLPLADVTVIQYTNPVLTGLFAALFLHESMSRGEWLGLGCSLLGVTLVAQPSFLFGAGANTLDLTAVVVALVGALLAALAYTTVRTLSRTEHHLVTVFYFPLIATPASIPVMAPSALWPTPVEWLLLLGVGITTQIAQVYLTKGLHVERAGRAMSMSYLQILFAGLWGALFFAEYPDPLTIVGAAFVVLGTFAVARR